MMKLYHASIPTHVCSSVVTKAYATTIRSFLHVNELMSTFQQDVTYVIA